MFLRWVLEWGGVMSFVGLCNLLPVSWALGMGKKMGLLVWKLDKRDRTISLDNLQSAFQGSKNKKEIVKLSKACFQQLGESIVEYARFPRDLRKENEKRVSIEGLEHLLEARKKGKGVILLSGHFGNWELLGITLAQRGFAFHVVARRLDNPFLNAWVNRRRSMTGNKVIAKKQAMKTVLTLLKNGESVGFLLDQNAGSGEGVFVPFFNRPACTSKSVAVLALRRGVPVLPLFITRREGGQHRIRIEKELPIIRTGQTEEDIIKNTAQYTWILESKIREHPEQWVWIHRRWKTQPL
jgi:KDO2-lipid IV(A) lauroyltransferase